MAYLYCCNEPPPEDVHQALQDKVGSFITDYYRHRLLPPVMYLRHPLRHTHVTYTLASAVAYSLFFNPGIVVYYFTCGRRTRGSFLDYVTKTLEICSYSSPSIFTSYNEHHIKLSNHSVVHVSAYEEKNIQPPTTCDVVILDGADHAKGGILQQVLTIQLHNACFVVVHEIAAS